MMLLVHRQGLESETGGAACVSYRMRGAREGAVVEWWFSCFLSQHPRSLPIQVQVLVHTRIQTRSYSSLLFYVRHRTRGFRTLKNKKSILSRASHTPT